MYHYPVKKKLMKFTCRVLNYYKVCGVFSWVTDEEWLQYECVFVASLEINNQILWKCLQLLVYVRVLSFVHCWNAIHFNLQTIASNAFTCIIRSDLKKIKESLKVCFGKHSVRSISVIVRPTFRYGDFHFSILFGIFLIIWRNDMEGFMAKFVVIMMHFDKYYHTYILPNPFPFPFAVCCFEVFITLGCMYISL